MNNDIRFDCPNCQRPMTGDVRLLAGFVDCPDCGQNFKPVRKPLTSSMVPALERSEKLHRQANGFAAAAMVAAALSGIILLFFVLRAVLNSEKFMAALIVAGAFLSIAFWLFLFAQIIHIRANTEK